jgi:hypothetical protein
MGFTWPFLAPPTGIPEIGGGLPKAWRERRFSACFTRGGCISLFWVPLLILLQILISTSSSSSVRIRSKIMIKIRKDDPKKRNARPRRKAQRLDLN